MAGSNGQSEESFGIIARQMILPPRMTGRSFLISLSRIFVLASLAQIAVSLLIRITGLVSLRFILFFFAAYLLFNWFLDRVQNAEFILTNQEIRLTRVIGIGSRQETRIPITEIVAVRQHAAGEDLGVTYHPVLVLQRSLKPTLRIRVSWMISYLSARLARKLAGKSAFQTNGTVFVQKESGSKKALLFPKNESFLTALQQALPIQFETDDRMGDEPVVTFRGRLLQRAFPALYPHVLPLISEDASTDAPTVGRRKKKKRQVKKKTQENT